MIIKLISKSFETCLRIKTPFLYEVLNQIFNEIVENIYARDDV